MANQHCFQKKYVLNGDSADTKYSSREFQNLGPATKKLKSVEEQSI